MSEVSFQLLWVDIFVFGIVQGFVNMFPHSGCGFFPSSCRVCFHYCGCYIFSGCLCSLFSMLNRFFVMMVVMSSQDPMVEMGTSGGTSSKLCRAALSPCIVLL